MKTKLNIGCGSHIINDYINLDFINNSWVDVVHNLEKYPYPFEDNTFEEIICNHILEHLNDLGSVINELWRISKPWWIIKIKSPYALWYIYFWDPSHKTPICYRTFENYNIDNPFINIYLTNFWSKARFKILKRKIIFSEMVKIWNFRILSFMDFFINLFPKIYERLFCFILPSEVIEIELKVIK